MIRLVGGVTMERALELATASLGPATTRAPVARGATVREMHARKATDAEIAAQLGVTLRYAAQLRRAEGLKANPPAHVPARLDGDECPEGHALKGRNLILQKRKNGTTRKRCRTCENERANARYRNTRGKN